MRIAITPIVTATLDFIASRLRMIANIRAIRAFSAFLALISEQVSTPMVTVESRDTQLVRIRTPFEALSNEAQFRVRELIESLDPLGKLVARARTSDRSRETKNRKDSVMNEGQPARRDLRLPKPGDVLSRRYKDREIVVRVLDSGFEFEGRRFRSLSAIAHSVTGAHWNGLLFFGIVRQER